MIRQRKPSKRADQTVLAIFAVRQLVGIGAITVITYLAFQVPDKRLGMVMVPFLMLYVGYSTSVVIKALSKYKQRYGGKS